LHTQQLAVLAGEARLAHAGEVGSGVDGLRGHAGAARQARVVGARVGHEAVAVGGRVAALAGQDVAQLAAGAAAHPVVVVVGGVVEQG